jgi:hypothetical protein
MTYETYKYLWVVAWRKRTATDWRGMLVYSDKQQAEEAASRARVEYGDGQVVAVFKYKQVDEE